MGIIMKERRDFIMEEEDVTTVLSAVNRHLSITNRRLTVCNCGWGGGEETKWFVTFYCRDGQYNSIIKDLLAVGKFETVPRPKQAVDLVFKRTRA